MYVSTHEKYTLVMVGDEAVFSVAEARERFSELIARAQSQAVHIERRGKPAVVVVSPERYEAMLEAFEEAQDTADFDEAMAEEGDNLPWDEVKADLGWA